MSCEVQLQKIIDNEKLYKVIVKQSYLIFFTKTNIYENMSADKVKSMTIPFVKRIYRQNVPNDVYPKNFYL
jgi:hypothetical protein